MSGIEAPAGRGASALQLDLRSPPPHYVCTAPSPSIVPCQQHPRQCVTGAASLHIHQSHSLFSQQASCSRAKAPNARQDETGRPILLPHVPRLPVQCLSALLASLGVRLLHHYNLVHYIPASVPRSLSLRALLGARYLAVPCGQDHHRRPITTQTEPVPSDERQGPIGLNSILRPPARSSKTSPSDIRSFDRLRLPLSCLLSLACLLPKACQHQIPSICISHTRHTCSTTPRILT